VCAGFDKTIARHKLSVIRLRFIKSILKFLRVRLYPFFANERNGYLICGCFRLKCGGRAPKNGNPEFISAFKFRRRQTSFTPLPQNRFRQSD
jgi:hypothetical protein